MEDAFSEIYRKLISRIEPEPARLLQGWRAVCRAVNGPDPPASGRRPLKSAEKYDIQGTEASTRSCPKGERGEET